MSKLEITVLPALSDNYFYFLEDTSTGTTAVVDPPVIEPVLDKLGADGKLDLIIATHHHADHTAGIAELKQKTGARVVGPAAEADKIPALDDSLSEGDAFAVGDASAQIFETPGHTAGHMSLYFADSKALFCADTLFALGCGRLFEGTPAQMWDSISKFSDLPDDAKVYCGHEYTLSNAEFAVTVDPDNDELKQRLAQIKELRANDQPTIPSTLGEERRTNPFMRANDPAIRAHLGMESASDAEVFGEIRKRKDNA